MDGRYFVWQSRLVLQYGNVRRISACAAHISTILRCYRIVRQDSVDHDEDVVLSFRPFFPRFTGMLNPEDINACPAFWTDQSLRPWRIECPVISPIVEAHGLTASAHFSRYQHLAV